MSSRFTYTEVFVPSTRGMGHGWMGVGKFASRSRSEGAARVRGAQLGGVYVARAVMLKADVITSIEAASSLDLGDYLPAIAIPT